MFYAGLPNLLVMDWPKNVHQLYSTISLVVRLYFWWPLTGCWRTAIFTFSRCSCPVLCASWNSFWLGLSTSDAQAHQQRHWKRNYKDSKRRQKTPGPINYLNALIMHWDTGMPVRVISFILPLDMNKTRSDHSERLLVHITLVNRGRSASSEFRSNFILSLPEAKVQVFLRAWHMRKKVRRQQRNPRPLKHNTKSERKVRC